MTDGRTDGRTDRQTDRQPWFYKTLRRTVCISLPLWQFKCLLSYWLSKNFTSATFYSYQLFCFLVSYFCTWNAPEFQINTVRLLIHKIRLTKIFKTFSSTVLPLEIYKIVFDLQFPFDKSKVLPKISSKRKKWTNFLYHQGKLTSLGKKARNIAQICQFG